MGTIAERIPNMSKRTYTITLEPFSKYSTLRWIVELDPSEVQAYADKLAQDIGRPVIKIEEGSHWC